MATPSSMNYIPIASGGAGGAAFCMLMQGTGATDAMAMVKCALAGAAGSFALTYIAKMQTAVALPDASTTDPMSLAAGLAYGFAGAYLLSMVVPSGTF